MCSYMCFRITTKQVENQTIPHEKRENSRGKNVMHEISWLGYNMPQYKAKLSFNLLSQYFALQKQFRWIIEYLLFVSELKVS